MTRLLFAAAVVTLLLGGGAAFILAALSRHKKAATGPLALSGARGRVLHDLTPRGTVLIKGEVWPARVVGEAQNLSAGASIRIVGANANGLDVESADEKRHI